MPAKLPPGPVIQCPINFSEGRRPEIIEAIADAIRGVAGAVLADYSWDFDHNRMVTTILGGPKSVEDAALAAAAVAVREIDLRAHLGVHPRIGAIDVVPLVPIRDISMDDCVAVSKRIAKRIGEELNIPIFLYEESASPGSRSALPDIRKGGFEGLGLLPLEGEYAPDFGPLAVHPTAGATVVGARGPLVAYNVNLDTLELAAAKRIAAEIRKVRELTPELQGVRALGLPLPSRTMVQVSMNLTKPGKATLPAVFRFIESSAEREGVGIRESEMIGLIPTAALAGASPEDLLWKTYKETQILEYWLE